MPNEILPISQLISLAKEQGIYLGKGNPENRLRYFIKIGLLPHMQRRRNPASGRVEGHLPVSVLATLKKIDDLKNQGYGVEAIRGWFATDKIRQEQTGQAPIQQLNGLIAKITDPLASNLEKVIQSQQTQNQEITEVLRELATRPSSPAPVPVETKPYPRMAIAGIIALVVLALASLFIIPRMITEPLRNEIKNLALKLTLEPATTNNYYQTTNNYNNGGLPVDENGFLKLSGISIGDGNILLDSAGNIKFLGKVGGGLVDTETENLLLNPGFEVNQSGKPTFWDYALVSSVGNTFVNQDLLNLGLAHFGQNSAKFYFNIGSAMSLGLAQERTKLTAGRTYTLSAWVKGDKLTNGTVRLGFGTLKSTGATNYQDYHLTSSFDWQRINYTFTATSNNFFPFFEARGYSGGSLYLDDAALVEGTASTLFSTTSTSYLGNGSLTVLANAYLYPTSGSSGELGQDANRFRNAFLVNADLSGTLTVEGLTTLNNNLGVGGAATVSGNVILGSNGEDTVAIKGKINTDLIPAVASTYNLGSLTNSWASLYVDNIYGSGTGTQGYWQRNAQALSPVNITDDVLLGATSTASALIKLTGTAGNNSWINTGNVGIGTTNPLGTTGLVSTQTKLAVVSDLGGGIGANSGIYISAGAAGSDWIQFERPSVSVWAIGAANGYFNLVERTGGVYRTPIVVQTGTPSNTLYLTSSGNVGIGTTSPQSQLDIAGKLWFSAVSGTYNINTDGTGLAIITNGGERFRVSGAYAYAQVPFQAINASTVPLIARGAASQTADLFNVQNSSGTPLVVVNSSGNVGIGVTNPSSKLQVAGNITPEATGTRDLGASSLYWANAYINNLYTGSSGTSGYWQRNAQALSPTNITDDVLLGATATASALIKLTGTSGNNSWINTGNVGIGTTSPGAALEVAGNILFSKETARTLSIARSTTAATVGKDLTISASGATSGETNLAGGNLYITSGISTGWAGSNIYLQTSAGGSSGTSDKALATRLAVSTYTDIIGVDQTYGLVVRGGANVGSAGVNSGQLMIGASAGYQGSLAYAYGEGSLYIDNTRNVDSGNIYFRTKTAGTAVNALTILGSGNVGIGTTSPQATLDVRSTLSVGTPIAGVSGVYNFVVNGPDAGIYQRRSGTNEPFIYLSTDTAGSGGQLRGLNAGGIRFTNPASAVEWARIDNSGNVGIGTTAPTALLDLAGATGASTSGILTFRGTTNPKINILNGEDFGIQTSVGGDAGLSERLTILNNGNVGIGTTVPGAMLDIKSPAGSTTNIRAIGITSQSAPLVYLKQGASASQNLLEGYNSAGTSIFKVSNLGEVTLFNGPSLTDSGNGGIRFNISGNNGGNVFPHGYTTTYTRFNDTAGNAALYVSGAGNIGIGVTNPSSKLQVAGNITPEATGTRDLGASSLYWANAYINNLYTGSSGTSGYWQRNAQALSPTNITDDILTGATATASALIKLTGTSGNNSWINTGNVGIGTTSPSSNLNVLGSFASTNDAQPVLTLDRKTTGSAAIGIGQQLLFRTYAGAADALANTSAINVTAQIIGAAITGRIGFLNNISGNGLSEKMSIRGNTVVVGASTATAGSHGLLQTVTDAGSVAIGNQSLLHLANRNSGNATGARAELSLSAYGDVQNANLGVVLTSAGGSSTGDFYIGTKLISDTYPTERLRITSGGNVGIGTTGPGAKLHIFDDSGTPAIALFEHSGTLTNASYTKGLIVGEGTTAGDMVLSSWTDGANNIAFLQTATWGSAYNLPLAIQPNGGVVGIGTTSPNTSLTLDVVGNGIGIARQLPIGANGQLELRGTSNATAGQVSAGVRFAGYGVLHGNLRYTPLSGSEGRFDLTTGNSVGTDVGTAHLYVSGNVGIGTTAPLAKLDVSGNATVSGNLTFYGGRTIQTTAMTPLVIGGDTTGNITLNPLNAVSGGYVAPAASSVSDLGTSALRWNNIYANTLQVYTSMSLQGDLEMNNHDILHADQIYFGSANPNGNVYLWYNPAGYLESSNDINTSGFLRSGGTIRLDSSGNLTNIGSISMTGSLTTPTSITSSGNIQGTTFTSTIAGGTAPLSVVSNTKVTNLNADLLDNYDWSSVGTNILPDTTGTKDLGSSSKIWNNLYVNNVLAGGTSGTQGWWQRNGQALSPTNITDDILTGATSTASALIKLTGTSGNNSWINTGNVGIGTTSPNKKLSVNGPLSVFKGTEFSYADPASTDFLVTNSVGNSRFLFGQSTTHYGGLYWNYNATVASAYMTVNITDEAGTVVQSPMTFLQSGNVGIGTTAPAGLLHVAATAPFVVTTVGNVGIGTTAPLNRLSVGSDSPFQVSSLGMIAAATGISSSGNIDFSSLSAGGVVKAAVTSGRLSIAAGGTDYEYPLTFNNGLTRATNVVKLGGALTAATDIPLGGYNLSFSGAGNVGIGTTAPTYKLDVSGTLRTSSTTTFNSLTYTWPGSQSENFILQTNGTGSLSWVDPNLAAASTIYWTQGSGILYPKNSTVDVLIGSTATASAKFAFMNVNDGTPTASVSAGTNGASYLTASGTLATTAKQTLTLGATDTGSVVIDSGINTILADSTIQLSGTNPTISATATNSTLGLAANGAGTLTLNAGATGNIQFFSSSNTLTSGGNLTIAGTTTFNSRTYTWPSSEGTNYVLSTSGSGILSWSEPGSLVGGINLWNQTDGLLSPKNSTVDLSIGGTATTSAKFMFMNVNSGNPTASISGNLSMISPTGANPATSYNILNGGTYDLKTSVGGDAGLTSRLFINNAGNVGIGTTTPSALFSVGSASQFQVNSAGSITSTGDGAGITFSHNSNHTISASSGTLSLGAVTLTGAITGGNQNITNIGNISANSSSNTITAFGTIGTASVTDFQGSTATLNSTANALTLSGAGSAIAFTGVTGTNQITTAASRNLAIMPGGNVGIGTTAPSDTLDVKGAIRIDNTTDGTKYTRMYTDSSGVGYIAPTQGTLLEYDGSTAFQFGLYNAATKNVQIHSNGISYLNGGNVGIGTTVPLAKLDVAGAASVSGNLSFSGARSIVGTSMNPLTLGDSNTGNVQFFNSSSYITSAGALTLASTASLGGNLSMNNNNINNIGTAYFGPANNVSLAYSATYGLLAGNAGMNLQGSLYTGNTERLDTSGNLLAIGSITMTGTLTTPTSITSSGNVQGTIFTSTVTTGTAPLVISSQTKVSNLNVDMLDGYDWGTVGTDIIPSVTSTHDLGSTTKYWDYVYANNIIAPVSGTQGYWQRNTNALSPANISDDILTGATATASALIKLTGTSGNNSWINTGNVGIGTTGPGAKLDVSGGGGKTSIFRNGSVYIDNFAYPGYGIFAYSRSTTGGGWPVLDLYSGAIGDSPESSGGNIRLSPRVGNIYVANALGIGIASPDVPSEAFDIGGSAANFTFSHSTGPHQIKTGGSSNLALMPGGNVGIGTTSPISKLHVSGAATGKALAIFNETGDQALFTASASGVSKFVIDHSGNVGVGTTAPTAALDVSGTASVSALTIRGSSPGYIDQLNGNDLRFRTSVGGDGGLTDRIILTNAGNLGIGTTSPGAPLDVTGSIYAVSTAIKIAYNAGISLNAVDFYGNGAISTSNNGNLYLTTNGTGNVLINNGNVGIGTTSPTALLDLSGATGASTSGILTFRGTTNPKINILNGEDFGIQTSVGGDAGLSERLTILNSGNVGIGTTGPGEKLVIRGNATQVRGWVMNDSTSGYAEFAAVNNNATANDRMTFGTGGTATGDIYQNKGYLLTGTNLDALLVQADKSTGIIQLFTGGSAAANERMRIDSNGNVGIGTTAPISKLMVQGAVTGKALAIFDETGDQALFTASASGVSKFVIDHSGNVGIGTTNPGYKLDVVGSARVKDTLYLLGSSGTSIGYIKGIESNITEIQGAGYVNAKVADRTSLSVAYTDIYSYSSLHMVDNTIYGSDTASGNLTLDSSSNATKGFVLLNPTGGNVGIGTTAPLSSLSVGSTSQFQVNSSGAMAAATGITSSGTITFSGLATSGPVYTSTGGVLNSETQLATSRGGLGASVTAAGAGEILYSSGPITYGHLAAGSSGQLLASGGAGAPSWTSNPSPPTSGTFGYWQRNLQALSPTNITDDVLVGAIATSSALVRLPGLTNENAWFNLGTGNLGVGTTAPASSLSVGTNTFQVNSSGNLIKINNVTYSWPSSQGGSSTVLTNNGSGTLTWETSSGGYWQRNSQALSPLNITDDVLVGAIATSSALVRLPGLTNENAFFNLGTGKVGIGTTTPVSGSKLQVLGGWVDVDRDSGGIRFTSTTNPRSTIYSNSSNDIFLSPYSTPNALTILNSNGSVGIGTTAPSSILDIYSATAANVLVRGDSGTNITAERYSTDATGPNFVVRKKRGSVTSPSAVATGDTLGNLFFSGFGGTTNRNIALLTAGVEAYVSDTDISSFFALQTTPAGSVTPVERVRITGSGKVGIGTASPVGYLSVQPNITAAASASNYAVRIDPALSGAINTAQLELFGNYTVPIVNLSGGTSNTLSWLYGNYVGATVQAGTATNWIGQYIASPTGAGTITNKYALLTEANAGNVGIGTVTPTSGMKLDVAGNIYASAGSVSGGNITIVFASGAYATSTSSTSYVELPGAAWGTPTYGGTRRKIKPNGVSAVYAANPCNNNAAVLSYSRLYNVEAATGYGEVSQLVACNAAGTTPAWVTSSSFTLGTTQQTYTSQVRTADVNFPAVVYGSYMRFDNGADLAEQMPSPQTLEPGDVVSVDPASTESVIRSQKAYDPTLVGIISTQPGVVLDKGGSQGYNVGIAGRVPTKVSTANGPIRKGDPLTSSNIPGVAMKATKSGNIIAKAMDDYSEPDPNKIGKIVAFINNTWINKDVAVEGEDGNVYIYNKEGEPILTLDKTGSLAVKKQVSAPSLKTDNLGSLSGDTINVNGTLATDSLFAKQSGILLPAGQTSSGDTVALANDKAALTKAASGLPPIGVVRRLVKGQADSLNPTGELNAEVITQGVAEAKVTLKNGPISHGELLSASDINGYLERNGKRAGFVVGQALENFNPDPSACSLVENANDIAWPEDTTLNDNYPCFRLADNTIVGKIRVLVNMTWYDPDVYLTSTGDLQIISNLSSPSADFVYNGNLQNNFQSNLNDAIFKLQNSAGEIITRIGTFSEAAIANLKSGLIQTQELIAEQKIVSPLVETETIKTNVISPLSDSSDVIVKLPNNSAESKFGQLLVQNDQGETVASVDAAGNATFSGTLYADEIVTKRGRFGDLIADHIDTSTISAQYVTNITNIYSTESGTSPAASDSGQLLADATASNSALLVQAKDWLISNLENDLKISSDIKILGHASLASTTIAGDLTVDAAVTINELGIQSFLPESTLYLQPLGLGGVDILAGKVTIDKDGNINVEGNLTVKGNITTARLAAADLEATGSAKFADLLVSKKLTVATASATVTESASEQITDASIGKAIIPAGSQAITIKTPQVTGISQVFITPTTPTENKVLYVSNQTDGQFRVEIDSPIDINIEFNWWLVN